MHIQSLLLLLFCGLAIDVASEIQLHHQNQKLGAKDILTLIPGIRPQDVCNLCTRILSTVKNFGNVQGQTARVRLMSAVQQECASFGRQIQNALNLNTPGAFCQEIGQRLIQFVGEALTLGTSFIQPGRDCRLATFC
ncbi:hypothetical protein M3Y98_00905000 [Aphelenchoides besseyi]|nr:hypothetical protein M3Y98_00905000 [Aphelenchoides besseyi]